MANSLSSRELLDRHFEVIYSYVAYRVAPDRDAACDITQEVFLAACKSTGSLRNDSAALAWLRAIARSKVADHFRASAARHNEVLAPMDALAELHVSDSSDAHDERQLRATQVSLVMRSLPDSYAEVLEEKYLDGLSVRAVAERRGQSEKAVESMLTRARDAFSAAWRRVQDMEHNLTDNARSPTHERQ